MSSFKVAWKKGRRSFLGYERGGVFRSSHSAAPEEAIDWLVLKGEVHLDV